jgi:hypothetical protein
MASKFAKLRLVRLWPWSDANGLHLAIGRHIASKSHMTGAEFGFLRKELDLSQTRFGALLDVVLREAVSLLGKTWSHT